MAESEEGGAGDGNEVFTTRELGIILAMWRVIHHDEAIPAGLSPAELQRLTAKVEAILTRLRQASPRGATFTAKLHRMLATTTPASAPGVTLFAKPPELTDRQRMILIGAVRTVAGRLVSQIPAGNEVWPRDATDDELIELVATLRYGPNRGGDGFSKTPEVPDERADAAG